METGVARVSSPTRRGELPRLGTSHGAGSQGRIAKGAAEEAPPCPNPAEPQGAESASLTGARVEAQCGKTPSSAEETAEKNPKD